MALTEKEIQEIREKIEHAARPLIFFDDDCDGLTSFLLIYNIKKEGKGIPIKASPKLEPEFARKVVEYQPDLVIILDKPMVSSEFFEQVKTPILWIDHHQPQKIKQSNVSYHNPRLHDDKDNRPTAYWCFKINNNPEMRWVAMVGCIGDWYIPEFIDDFKKNYASMLPETYQEPPDILYNSKLGELIRIFSFIIKGKVSEVIKCMKILTRVNSPEEILEKKTSRGKLLHRVYEKFKKIYDNLYARASSVKPDGNLLLFVFENSEHSFSSDLSNELLYKHPDVYTIIARKKNDSYNCSLRANLGVFEPLQKALEGIKGYGGGHTNACGAHIAENDFSRFIEQFKEAIKD